MLLRIKDDCRPFNPQERAEMHSDDDPLANIGIRMVSKISDEMTYNNMLGLNVPSVTLDAAATTES